MCRAYEGAGKDLLAFNVELKERKHEDCDKVGENKIDKRVYKRNQRKAITIMEGRNGRNKSNMQQLLAGGLPPYGVGYKV